MTNTVIEYVPALLVQDGKPRDIKLKLTVKELTTDERFAPVVRAIARAELASANGLEDGSYTLRYTFDGKQEVDFVRVKYGMLLSGSN